MFAKLIGAGLATISIGGSGAGIGFIFSGLLQVIAANPAKEKILFTRVVPCMRIATTVLGVAVTCYFLLVVVPTDSILEFGLFG